jgi:hypothetical protein
VTAADFALHRLTHGCGGGIAESAAFILIIDPTGGDISGDGDESEEGRDPRAEKLRDWRHDGRPRVKARAEGGVR